MYNFYCRQRCSRSLTNSIIVQHIKACTVVLLPQILIVAQGALRNPHVQPVCSLTSNPNIVYQFII